MVLELSQAISKRSQSAPAMVLRWFWNSSGMVLDRSWGILGWLWSGSEMVQIGSEAVSN